MIVLIKQKLRNILIKIALINPRFSSLYYFLFSTRFDDIHFSVISGVHENRTNKNNIGNFRRSIHRLEKGLITMPQREFFGESYISETVKIYQTLLKETQDTHLTIWAENVLREYFERVKHTSIIEQAFNKFSSLNRTNVDNNAKPFKYASKESPIRFDDFLSLNKARRSVRYYTSQPVSKKIIEKAINTALYAPSACNRQPYTFHILEGNNHINKCNHTPDGAQSFSYNINTMIYIIGNFSNYFHERDKNIIYVDGGLITMNLVLALQTLGISSCIVNWGDVKDKNRALSKKLNLKPFQKCITTLSIGYGMEGSGIPSSIKKSLKSVVKYHS